MNPIIERLRNAVVALCEGRVAEAEQELHAIDFPGLRRDRRAAYDQVWRRGGVATGFKRRFPGTERINPSEAVKRATFIRDGYTCRYSHCRRPVVSLDVLKLLSKVFPDVLPCRSNWPGRDDHILYYTYSPNLEHLRAFSEIGPSAAATGNLITACYECGDTKGDLPIELLGWEVRDPPETDWAGLTEYIPRLLTSISALPRLQDPVASEPPEALETTPTEGAIARTSIPAIVPSPIVPMALQVGNLISAQLPGKKKAGQYRVDDLSSSTITVCEMWRRDSDRSWVASRNPRSFPVTEFQSRSVLRFLAPAEGGVDLAT
jgi:5-methylcytosine-specific restriction endonuclease McrA